MLEQLPLKEIKIEVTQKCNLNCMHCSSEANISKDRELTLDLVLRLINEASEMKVNEVTFSGGEPLLWEHLSIAIKYCYDLGIMSTIYTTGNPIIDDITLFDSLNLNLANKAILSLYAANSEVHESITRIHGSFNKTVEAIKTLTGKGIPVGIHFVAMAPNWEELGSVVELGNRLNVQEVSVLRFVPHGRGAMVEDYSLQKKQLKILRQEIVKLRATSKIQIRLGSPFNILMLNEDVYCNAAQDRLIIGSDGKVFPCDAFKNVDYVGQMGSVVEHSLLEIWNGSEYLNAVRKIIAQGYGPECSKCKSCQFCKGGCLAQKVIRMPKDKCNITKPDPDCLLH